MEEENIGIAFDGKDFDEIMAYAEKGEFETVQEAIMSAVRACTNNWILV